MHITQIVQAVTITLRHSCCCTTPSQSNHTHNLRSHHIWNRGLGQPGSRLSTSYKKCQTNCQLPHLNNFQIQKSKLGVTEISTPLHYASTKRNQHMPHTAQEMHAKPCATSTNDRTVGPRHRNVFHNTMTLSIRGARAHTHGAHGCTSRIRFFVFFVGSEFGRPLSGKEPPGN